MKDFDCNIKSNSLIHCKLKDRLVLNLKIGIDFFFFWSRMAVSYYLCPQSLRVSSGSRLFISNSGYSWDNHKKRIHHLVCASARQPEKDLCLESKVFYYLM